MKVKKSPFILKSFLLLKQNIDFISMDTEASPDVLSLFDSYNIDIDFAVNDVDKTFTNIFVKIEVNTDKNHKAGYKITAEGVGVFEFEKQAKLTKQQKANYIYFSGISICINSLRAIITNITAYCPFGKYTLPSIDVNSLLTDTKQSGEK